MEIFSPRTREKGFHNYTTVAICIFGMMHESKNTIKMIPLTAFVSLSIALVI